MLTQIMTKNKRKGWLSRLFDMNDTSVSASTVFLMITSAIALILLLIPAIALLIDVFFNHTIMTDLSGMAAYITAVCGIFASGGILKGWTNYSNYKFNKKKTTEIFNGISELTTEETDNSEDGDSFKNDLDEEELDA